jgi:hypothetical protein
MIYKDYIKTTCAKIRRSMEEEAAFFQKNFWVLDIRRRIEPRQRYKSLFLLF